MEAEQTLLPLQLLLGRSRRLSRRDLVAAGQAEEGPRRGGPGLYPEILELLPEEKSDQRGRENSLSPCRHFLGFKVAQWMMRLKASGGSLGWGTRRGSGEPETESGGGHGQPG